MDEGRIHDQLRHISPDDYDTWVRVGAALKHEGLPCSVWDDWSRGSAKYVEGECERKWASFVEGNAGEPVTGGTIWHLAELGGWSPPRPCGELSEGMLIRSSEPERIIDPSFARESVPGVPKDYDPVDDAMRYLREMFEPDEFVGFCVKSQPSANGAKLVPASDGQVFGFRARDLLADLERTHDLGRSGFVADPQGGAWIRFNPLDGRGCGNSNVTRFTYALVESDDDEIEKQYAIYQQLNLPIKVLVHSGNKSLHAIVRVDARDASEYRERVRLLYSTCSDNGLHVDEQDKNASRYSRFPGFRRGGEWQRSVAWDMGARSWAEWVDWLEGEKDTLPDSVGLDEAFADLPPLRPVLVEGLLRFGHKMLIAAQSKAGKSFLLMELAVSIAEGIPWVGHDVAQGRVLYVNLELDPASCLHRFHDIYERLGIEGGHARNITVLNLRGHATNLAELGRVLVRRFKDKGYTCMIFDPLYKVNDGDENNAGDMTKLCNQFDAIARECGCACAYSHHYSKGAGAKYASSMDRASGSGVFARDPDCIVSMSEIQVSDMHARMYRESRGLPEDKRLTAWELEYTVREFPNPDPTRIWFDWPVHVPDAEGWLNDARGDETNGSGVGREQARRSERQSEIMAAFGSLVCPGDNAVRREELLGHLRMTSETKWDDKSIGNALNKSPYKSSVIKGGTHVIAPRDAIEIRLDGARYTCAKPGAARAVWVLSEGGEKR